MPLKLPALNNDLSAHINLLNIHQENINKYQLKSIFNENDDNSSIKHE